MHIPAALFVVFWMWSDLVGTLLSVISTYFYFGWEQVPMRTPKIFGIALLAFSAPSAYRLLLARWPAETLIRGLSLGLFVTYLSLALNRQTNFFAWGSVFGVWLGGLALMAILRSLQRVPLHGLTPYVLLMSVLFFLSTRISQAGLPLLLAPPEQAGIVAWGPLAVFVLGAIALPNVKSRRADPLPQSPQNGNSLGWVFGLLSGLSVGLIFNLHLWSAQQGDLAAVIWFLPVGLGALLGSFAYERLAHTPRIGIGLASIGVALGLAELFYFPHAALPWAFGALGFASAGLLMLWAWFFHLWKARLQEQPLFFPWLTLQGGCIALLFILTVFLLQANPNGFWLALAASSGILFWQAPLLPLPQPLTGAVRRLWIYSSSVFALMGLTVLLLPIPTQESQSILSHTDSTAPDSSVRPLQIMTTNVRYGWTDDYRLAPQIHVDWLKRHLPDLIGVQELNKGHTSGAYSDLFRYYQRALPGQWHYGDAHYGFGNALFSRLPVEHVEVRPYRAKDLLKRSCLIATARWQGKPIKVFVTHLSHLPPPNPVREDQMAELREWIKDTHEPWILLGDFNATPEMPEVKKLLPLAHPVFQERPELLSTPSFPSLKPRIRIDYIWFSPHFELQNMQVLDNAGSTDHRPVVAELILPHAGVAK